MASMGERWERADDGKSYRSKVVYALFDPAGKEMDGGGEAGGAA
jgi:hypothetical protein